jgi:serine/threonine protein kinase
MDEYSILRRKADKEHREDQDSDLSTSLDSSDEEAEKDETMQEIKQTFHRKGPQDFERITLLGRGDVGRVYLVRMKGTDKLYAMKVLKKEDMIRRKKVSLPLFLNLSSLSWICLFFGNSNSFESRQTLKNLFFSYFNR